MKHATSRMLFASWDALRGERAAPERADVRPGDMRHILADTFVLGADAAEPPSFRLAGTRLNALFGRDLKGVDFARLWTVGERDEALRLVEVCLDDTVGVVAGLVGTNENGSELPLELLLLPLRHRGRTDLRLLGALSPASVPSWAGLVPLRGLGTRSVRIIEPSGVPGGDAREDHAVLRRRTLFVVHDGGTL